MSKDKKNMPTSLTIDTVTGPRHSWWRAVVPLSTNDGPPLPPQWYALRMHPLWLCNEWPRETGCGSFYNLRCSNLRTNSLERNIASLVSILQLLESLLNFGGKSGDFGPIHRIREKTPKIGGAENPARRYASRDNLQLFIDGNGVLFWGCRSIFYRIFLREL